MHATQSIGEEEQVVRVVPRDLVHLEAEWLLHANFIGARVNECNKILLVPYSYCPPIRGPGNVDVFSLRASHSCRFCCAVVPDAYSLVSAGRGE